MGWPQCNSTLEDQGVSEKPIWNDYTFHRMGLWLSAIFGLVAIVVSFVLIFLHSTHYLKPYEQRHIIRILFMVPVYAAVSFLSFLYYQHSIYFEVLRDCYEAFAIASFFSLLCAYIEPDLHAQKEYFRMIQPRKWIWPMRWIQKCWGGEKGIWRTPRSGLTWFNVIWVSIFQYCFIRVFMTCVAVVTQVFNRYCLESLNPAFAHVWVMVIEAIAVTVAMYCLIQFYYQIKDDIRQHKPLLKVAAIKLVIFLSFWQTMIISFLTSTGIMKASDKFQTPDIKVGIPAMLLCIEMALFSIFHIWAFSWRPYSLTSKEYRSEIVPGEISDRTTYQGGFLGVRAIMDSFNPWDLIKAVGRAAKWLFRDRKHRHHDVSYDLSRKNTDNSDLATGQKLTTFDQHLNNSSTIYLGGRLNQGGKSSTPATEEGENLLNNTQSIPMSKPYTNFNQPGPSKTDSSDEEFQENEIGVAKSIYNEPTQGYGQGEPDLRQHEQQRRGENDYYDQGRYEQQQQQQQGQRPGQLYSSDIGMAAPYPDAIQSNQRNPEHMQMPQFPQPNNSRGRGHDNMF